MPSGGKVMQEKGSSWYTHFTKAAGGKDTRSASELNLI